MFIPRSKGALVAKMIRALCQPFWTSSGEAILGCMRFLRIQGSHQSLHYRVTHYRTSYTAMRTLLIDLSSLEHGGVLMTKYRTRFLSSG